ncbi:MAG: DUF3466 family protein [Phycisphaeraceae bacterium]|nr:DUF3466 family protein [Phycisphaeraceae bacterium]
MKYIAIVSVLALLTFAEVSTARTTRAFLMTPNGDGSYSLVALEPPGGLGSEARAVNEAGQVAGYGATLAGHTEAFLWTPDGSAFNLGTYGDDRDSIASGINDSGEVVGTSNVWVGADEPNRAFIWSEEDGMRLLGSLDDDWNQAFAEDINNNREVVGSSTSTGFRAFLWTETDGMHDLGTLGGGETHARAINELGEVAGDSKDLHGYQHAFFWSETLGLVDLGTLANDMRSFGLDINDLGQVVGWSRSANLSEDRAFLWTEQDGMQDIGTLGGTDSAACAINNLGQVVGYSYEDGLPRAFIWSPDSGILDLNDLVVPEADYFHLAVAFDINDAGQIVGYGYIPEPATLLLLLLPACGLLNRRSANSIAQSRV